MTKCSFLTTFFETLNREDVDYFVLGTYKNLPQDTGGSDIDIVVSENQVQIVEQTLRKLYGKSELKLVSYYENFNTLFYRLLSINWGIQIDVFYKGLCYKGIEYYPIYLLKPHIINFNNIKVLDEKLGFYVDYFKEILHNGVAKEKYRKAVVDLIQSDENTYREEIKKIYGIEAVKLVCSNLTCEKLNIIGKELQQIIRKRILQRHSFQVAKVQLKLLTRLFSTAPGYVIVVEGTDGSGKSTIINSITPILNEAFHNGVVYNHLRPNLIPNISVLLGKKDKEEAKVVNSDPHGQKISGVFGSIFRWGYYMLDYTFGYLKKVWPVIHSKSKVFLFDRYYYDYYIDQKRSRTSLPRWIIAFGEYFVPRPDLILCLGGEPSLVFKRKPETSLEEVERQTNVLKSFSQQRKNAVWIDTTIPIDESINETMTAIVNMMNRGKYE